MSKSHRSEGGEVKQGRVVRREKTVGSRKKEDKTQDETKTRRSRERKGTSNREDEEDDAAAPELSSDSQCTVITPVTSLPPPGPLARAELQSHSSASIHSTAIRQKALLRSRAAALIHRLATCCFIDHDTNVIMLHFN